MVEYIIIKSTIDEYFEYPAELSSVGNLSNVGK